MDGGGESGLIMVESGAAGSGNGKGAMLQGPKEEEVLNRGWRSYCGRYRRTAIFLVCET